jgi:hypothetical protein
VFDGYGRVRKDSSNNTIHFDFFELHHFFLTTSNCTLKFTVTGML